MSHRPDLTQVLLLNRTLWQGPRYINDRVCSFMFRHERTILQSNKSGSHLRKIHPRVLRIGAHVKKYPSVGTFFHHVIIFA